jgi:phosphoribosyl-AMP cyclohydrolase
MPNQETLNISPLFAKRNSIEQVEEGHELSPKFDQDGLIAVVTTSSENKEVLMLGYMNSEALIKTIETGEAHYYSRSRKVLWHKGANSGLIQKVKELKIDDDQDALWMSVEVVGKASCHVGYRSCFYRAINLDQTTLPMKLSFTEQEKSFDPKKIYGDVPNPTKL